MGDFEGSPDRECGEHRTTGDRAWCHGCSEWCYPDSPCKGCELPQIRAKVAVLDLIDELAFKILAGEGETKREAQDKLGDLLAARLTNQLRETMSTATPQVEPNYPCDGCGGSGERINRLEGYSEPCWCVR